VSVAAAVLIAVLCTVLWGAPIAGAHATLLSSSPVNDSVIESAPAEVVLRFDEAVAPADQDALVVLDSGGDHLERGRVERGDGGRRVSMGIRDGGTGTYTVSYRVLSEDDHVISGSFVFHVGAPSGSTRTDEASTSPLLTVLGVLGRWLAFGGPILAVGALVAAVLVDRPEERARKAKAGGGVLWPERRIWWFAALLGLLGAILSIVVLSAELAGGTLRSGVSELPALAETLGWADTALWRLPGALLFALLVMLPRRWRWPPWAAASVAVVQLCLPAFGGHASTTSVLAEALIVMHLLAAATWIGALVAIALSWRADRGRLAGFGRLALPAAGVVLVTGLVMALWLSGVPGTDVEAVVSTGWWKALVVKVSMVAVIVMLGWAHRRWIHDVERPVAPMRSSIRFEAVVAAAVILATAVLVDLPPPDSSATVPFQAVRQAGDVTVRLQVVPAEAGSNGLHLYFLALDGDLSAVDAAEVQVSSSEVAPRRVPVELVTPSHATGSVELTSGTWTVEVTVLVRGSRSSAEVEVPIR
jgi:copper transport protein